MVSLHRYIGVAIAAFLVSAGLTGSLLVWNDELERVFAPALFTLPPHAPGAMPLDPFVLRDRVASAFPAAAISGLPLGLTADQSVPFDLDYPENANKDGGLPDDQVFVDPVTATVLGTRRAGDLAQGVKNLMPFVDSVHENLVMGDAGATLLGVVALLWTLQCVLGLYLTLPVARANGGYTRSWWARWKDAWSIRSYGDLKRILFDVHRAGGLWAWSLLFVFAWSAVSFNLQSVYEPVMRNVFGESSTHLRIQTPHPPRLDWRQAYSAARAALDSATRGSGIEIRSERLMMYHADRHTYEYRVQTSRDVEARGNTRVFVNADTGAPLGIDYPTGGALGTTLTTWIEALHEGMVIGAPYKFVVSAVGIFVTVLSGTGVFIWTQRSRFPVAAMRFLHRASRRLILGTTR